MDVDVLPFDPEAASREEWARYVAHRRRSLAERYPEDPLPSDRAFEAWTRLADPNADAYRFLAVPHDRPGEAIGSLEFRVFRKDSPSYEANKGLAFVWFYVEREDRRQGVGTLLLREVARLAKAHGRTVFETSVDRTDPDAEAFAHHVGFQVIQDRRENRLRLDDVDWAMVEEWVEDGASRNPNTALRSCTDRIDDDVIEEYARAFTEVFNQQPFGDSEFGGLVITPEQIRLYEAEHRETRTQKRAVFTQEADGTVSALTETGYEPDRGTMLFQWMTGVREAHRGRGLGKWIKAAMLLRVREEVPAVRVVVTGNASDNAAMLSINERLGYRKHREGIEVKISLDALEAYLAGRPP